ncbi:MAG TPA: ATP-dependent Clp protease adaptor ClpS [Acidimicrobiales bacterium]|nr:ATP-dependent Clp protease adaptor ClpS [Acidimicrobiales bacterium]
MSQTLDSSVIQENDIETFLDEEDPWAVLVWNDDVNTFDHVIKALIDILNHSRARAEQLALRVHNTGKAVVAVRPKEEAVAAARRFQDRGIWATVER